MLIVTQLEVIISPYQLINEFSLIAFYDTVCSYVEILSIHRKNPKLSCWQQIHWNRYFSVFPVFSPSSIDDSHLKGWNFIRDFIKWQECSKEDDKDLIHIWPVIQFCSFLKIICFMLCSINFRWLIFIKISLIGMQ